MREKIQKIFFNLEIISFDYAERKHLPSGVNMLTKNPNISDTTKLEFSKLISFQSNQKISQKYWRLDLSSLSVPLTCWPSISVLTAGFVGM